MRISVVGVGYVGLVSGACFAETGNTVVCMDIDMMKVERLQNGEIPIYEPQLEEIVKNNLAKGRLRFTTSIEEAVAHGLIIFHCGEHAPGRGRVRRPAIRADRGPRHRQVHREVSRGRREIDGAGGHLREGEGRDRAEIDKRGLDIPFDIASNPEFLKEGMAVDDCMKPERIVVGSPNSRVEEILGELYAPFVRTGAPLISMDLRSSEMTKYTANAMLATRISFMNEIANVCERVGADVMKVMRGIGTDSRIGPKFLFPGVGFGGSCFPKDVRAPDQDEQ